MRLHPQGTCSPVRSLACVALLGLTGCLATSLDDPPMDPGPDPGDPGNPGDPGDPGNPVTPTGGFALASSDHGLAYLANV